MTKYEVLFDGVIDRLESLGYLEHTEEAERMVYDLLLVFLTSAIVSFKVCKQDLSDRDDLLQFFNCELTDEEIIILTNFLLIEYISATYINTPLLLRPSLPNKDRSAFSPRNHLEGLLNLRETYERENRQKISMYSNMGSDLFEKMKARRGIFRDDSSVGSIVNGSGGDP